MKYLICPGGFTSVPFKEKRKLACKVDVDKVHPELQSKGPDCSAHKKRWRNVYPSCCRMWSMQALSVPHTNTSRHTSSDFPSRCFWNAACWSSCEQWAAEVNKLNNMYACDFSACVFFCVFLYRYQQIFSESQSQRCACFSVCFHQ